MPLDVSCARHRVRADAADVDETLPALRIIQQAGKAATSGSAVPDEDLCSSSTRPRRRRAQLQPVHAANTRYLERGGALLKAKASARGTRGRSRRDCSRTRRCRWRKERGRESPRAPGRDIAEQGVDIANLALPFSLTHRHHDHDRPAARIPTTSASAKWASEPLDANSSRSSGDLRAGKNIGHMEGLPENN